MLKPGDIAPTFSAPSSVGRYISLNDLRGGLVIVYFFQSVHRLARSCTKQARRFRDNYPELKQLGAEVIGISTESLDGTCQFALQNQVTFPLIGDDDGAISRAWGVLRPLLNVDKRMTFILDEAGVIRAVFQHEFQVSRHLDDVLLFVRRHAEAAAQAHSSPPSPRLGRAPLVPAK